MCIVVWKHYRHKIKQLMFSQLSKCIFMLRYFKGVLYASFYFQAFHDAEKALRNSVISLNWNSLEFGCDILEFCLSDLDHILNHSTYVMFNRYVISQEIRKIVSYSQHMIYVSIIMNITSCRLMGLNIYLTSIRYWEGTNIRS